MEKHLYRITLEHLAAPHGEKVARDPVRFEAISREHIFILIEYLKQRKDVPPEMAEVLGTGLKLCSEPLWELREIPLFQSFVPHFLQFMEKLEKRIP